MPVLDPAALHKYYLKNISLLSQIYTPEKILEFVTRKRDKLETETIRIAGALRRHYFLEEKSLLYRVLSFDGEKDYAEMCRPLVLAWHDRLRQGLLDFIPIYIELTTRENQPSKK